MWNTATAPQSDRFLMSAIAVTASSVQVEGGFMMVDPDSHQDDRAIVVGSADTIVSQNHWIDYEPGGYQMVGFSYAGNGFAQCAPGTYDSGGLQGLVFEFCLLT